MKWVVLTALICCGGLLLLVLVGANAGLILGVILKNQFIFVLGLLTLIALSVYYVRRRRYLNKQYELNGGRKMAKATWNEVVLAKSDKYEVVEGNIYFPPESVKWEYFNKGDRQYTCPWKGETSYHNITVGDQTNQNAAWSYPDPKPAAKQIKGHVAFERGKGVKVVR